jgi:hypothetical protein
VGNNRAVDAPTIDQLNDEIRDGLLQVHNAQERLDERDVVQAAHETIARVAERYRVLMQSLSGADQIRAERALGRRLMDLKRLGSLLPKMAISGAESTPDRVAGGGAVHARRITGVSWSQHDRAAPTGAAKVGADIEAWCGKCGESTTHSIVAMVGTEPKQVLCQVCGSRHAYRTSPARPRAAKAGEAGTTGGDDRPRVSVDPEAARRAAQLRALGEEVAAAAEVRRFDPKERYKAGEIISHPEYGRGKVENVLRSSLLVRFSVGGLKSLMLV